MWFFMTLCDWSVSVTFRFLWLHAGVFAIIILIYFCYFCPHHLFSLSFLSSHHSSSRALFLSSSLTEDYLIEFPRMPREVESCRWDETFSGWLPVVSTLVYAAPSSLSPSCFDLLALKGKQELWSADARESLIVLRHHRKSILSFVLGIAGRRRMCMQKQDVHFKVLLMFYF